MNMSNVRQIMVLVELHNWTVLIKLDPGKLGKNTFIQCEVLSLNAVFHKIWLSKWARFNFVNFFLNWKVIFRTRRGIIKLWIEHSLGIIHLGGKLDLTCPLFWGASHPMFYLQLKTDAHIGPPDYTFPALFQSWEPLLD